MAASREKGVIRAQALAKHYDAKVAGQDVSLFLQGGESVGLLGPNGAGKTTTFYMVVGLIEVSAYCAAGVQAALHRALVDQASGTDVLMLK